MMGLPLMATNPRYARYSIGRWTYGDPRVEDFGGHATLVVGSFCSFARDVTILLSGEHRVEWVTTSPLAHFFGGKRLQSRHNQNHAKGDVQIGSDVWIGLGATILGGVTIGHGAVVGARSVVTRNVEPYSIVAGNPACFRKWRFADAHRPLGRVFAYLMPTICQRLLTVKWWDWDDAKIREFLPLLMSNRVEEFSKRAEALQCG